MKEQVLELSSPLVKFGKTIDEQIHDHELMRNRHYVDTWYQALIYSVGGIVLVAFGMQSYQFGASLGTTETTRILYGLLGVLITDGSILLLGYARRAVKAQGGKVWSLDVARCLAILLNLTAIVWLRIGTIDGQKADRYRALSESQIRIGAETKNSVTANLGRQYGVKWAEYDATESLLERVSKATSEPKQFNFLIFMLALGAVMIFIEDAIAGLMYSAVNKKQRDGNMKLANSIKTARIKAVKEDLTLIKGIDRPALPKRDYLKEAREAMQAGLIKKPTRGQVRKALAPIANGTAQSVANTLKEDLSKFKEGAVIQ